MPGTLFLWPLHPVTEVRDQVRGEGDPGRGETVALGHTRAPVPADQDGDLRRPLPCWPPGPSLSGTQDAHPGREKGDTIGKLLQEFEKAGLLDARYGRITILDAPRLMMLVQRD